MWMSEQDVKESRARPEVRRILNRTAEDGSFSYCEQEVVDTIGLVLLFDAAHRPLDGIAAALVMDLLARAGVGPQAETNEVQQCLNEYFEKHPLSKGLIDDLRAYMRTEGVEEEDTDADLLYR